MVYLLRFRFQLLRGSGAGQSLGFFQSSNGSRSYCSHLVDNSKEKAHRGFLTHLIMLIYATRWQGCHFFLWYPHLANQVVDFSAKRGSKPFQAIFAASIIIRKHLGLLDHFCLVHFVECSSCFFIRFCILCVMFKSGYFSSLEATSREASRALT